MIISFVNQKGGVGKTTFAALLIKTLSAKGKRVLAIDADPDANLAAGLGIDNADGIVPISEMKDLVFERTGAQPGTVGGFFKLNPKVDDLPDALSVKLDNIKFMRLGEVKKGGGGCICPESTLLKALVTHIVLARNEVVVMDMEAGIELAMMWRSATDAGRTGAKGCRRAQSFWGLGCPKMYHEHGDTPGARLDLSSCRNGSRTGW